ncbi:MAG: hypothetical protein KC656_27305, partial [Myxococcales bacterium]|nr:hypothetical protein [Myxococcales bacterium]
MSTHAHHEPHGPRLRVWHRLHAWRPRGVRLLYAASFVLLAWVAWCPPDPGVLPTTCANDPDACLYLYPEAQHLPSAQQVRRAATAALEQVLVEGRVPASAPLDIEGPLPRRGDLGRWQAARAAALATLVAHWPEGADPHVDPAVRELVEDTVRVRTDVACDLVDCRGPAPAAKRWSEVAGARSASAWSSPGRLVLTLLSALVLVILARWAARLHLAGTLEVTPAGARWEHAGRLRPTLHTDGRVSAGWTTIGRAAPAGTTAVLGALLAVVAGAAWGGWAADLVTTGAARHHLWAMFCGAYLPLIVADAFTVGREDRAPRAVAMTAWSTFAVGVGAVMGFAMPLGRPPGTDRIFWVLLIGLPWLLVVGIVRSIRRRQRSTTA